LEFGPQVKPGSQPDGPHYPNCWWLQPIHFNWGLDFHIPHNCHKVISKKL
jgi:hypothetical protein